MIITALTSKVGEVAVVRASASYKCGGGQTKLIPILTFPNWGRNTRCRSINALPAPDNRVYLPSWGGRSCANVSELQMRVGQTKLIPILTFPNWGRNARCRPISALPASNNRVYLPSWGGRSCANVSELQMRVGFRQRKVHPHPNPPRRRGNARCRSINA